MTIPKTLLAVAFLSLASTAQAACPNLAGSYSPCATLRAQNPPGAVSVKVDQKLSTVTGEIIDYNFRSVLQDGSVSESSYFANGQPIDSEDTSGKDLSSKATTVTRCEGNRLLVASETLIPQLGLKLSIEQAVSKTPAGDLMFDVSLNGSAPVMIICKKAAN